MDTDNPVERETFPQPSGGEGKLSKGSEGMQKSKKPP
jgi:hypothetical protein